MTRIVPSGQASSGGHIWVYLDAVDGTVKLAGLNNQPGRLRAANDGSWSIGIAFTLPSSIEQQRELSFSDFKVSAIIDGSMTSSTSNSFPAVAVAVASIDSDEGSGLYSTFEGSIKGPRLFTSSNTVLSQSFVYLDSFQVWSSLLKECKQWCEVYFSNSLWPCTSLLKGF